MNHIDSAEKEIHETHNAQKMYIYIHILVCIYVCVCMNLCMHLDRFCSVFMVGFYTMFISFHWHFIHSTVPYSSESGCIFSFTIVDIRFTQYHPFA